MDRYERLNTLLEILGGRGRLEVNDIAVELRVSAATIRRDLDHLAEQQLLTRTRGGAVTNNVSYDLPLRYKTARHATEKQRIARATARLLTPGLVVALNGGTTTTEVARAIATRPELNGTSGSPGVVVVTNALNIANELAVRPDIKIVVTGGVARPQSFELIGPLATGILDEITLDVAIVGVDAIDPQHGASAHHEGEASINALMVMRARDVIVAADSSKLGRHAFARICPIQAVRTLVTDTAASDQEVRGFEETGLRVLRA